ncbi:MAG: RDD family protein [Planctomycetes bacterium]|nr:RDD family protein [Planctomycetota bacterium]
MPERENLPDLLRERLATRRRRFKFVLGSLGATVVASIVVFFLLAANLGGATGSRLILAVAGPGGDVVLVDQSLPLAAGGDKPGTFRLFDVTGQGLTPGPSFGGVVRSLTLAGRGNLFCTSGGRLLRFERKDGAWVLAESVSLGLNDPEADPVTVFHDGTLWLFWKRGLEVMLRPALQPDAEPHTVFKAASTLGGLGARSAAGAVWISALESRSGQLTLLAVRPSLDADGKTTVEVLRKGAAPQAATRSSLAVFGTDARAAVPVLALVRKDDTSRAWVLKAWVASSNPEGEWLDVVAPPRASVPSSLDGGGFLTLLGQGGDLRAWYSDGGAVKHSRARFDSPGQVQWGEPEVLELDKRGGMDGLVWGAVLFCLGLVMTSQFVWLILNRERPQDRAISTLLHGGQGGKPLPKPEEKLVFASAPARALALLIDLALTSPAVILLQGVYRYRWEDAYGFIVLLNWGGMDHGILASVTASLVTLTMLVIYSMFCELMWGRTLGKALFRLRVVDLEGETPAPWRIVVRNVLKIAEMIHWTVLIIPMALMLFSGKQQRLGDLAGGTLVVVDVVPEESPDDIDV